MILKRLVTAGVLSGLMACTPPVDISADAPITLPRYSKQKLLRYEEVTVRAVFLGQQGGYSEIKDAACKIKGPGGTTSITPPVKVRVPVYPGIAPTYQTTCKTIVGASVRTGTATIKPLDATIAATADNAPTYSTKGGVPFRAK